MVGRRLLGERVGTTCWFFFFLVKNPWWFWFWFWFWLKMYESINSQSPASRSVSTYPSWTPRHVVSIYPVRIGYPGKASLVQMGSPLLIRSWTGDPVVSLPGFRSLVNSDGPPCFTPLLGNFPGGDLPYRLGGSLL